MARIHTIDGTFQSSDGAANQNLKDRWCPGMRSCWNFSFQSYNPFGRSSNTDRFRRVFMIVALASYAALDLRILAYMVVKGRVLDFLVTLLIYLICGWFTAYCLAVIGEAEGERVVMKCNVGRRHFDAFLCFYAVMHASILVGLIFGIRMWWVGLGLGIPMWLLLLAVAWIARWEPNSVSLPY